MKDVTQEHVDEEEEAKKEAEARIQIQQQKEWLRMLRQKRIILRYVHPQPVYLLFNPWHESKLSTTGG